MSLDAFHTKDALWSGRQTAENASRPSSRSGKKGFLPHLLSVWDSEGCTQVNFLIEVEYLNDRTHDVESPPVIAAQ